MMKLSILATRRALSALAFALVLPLALNVPAQTPPHAITSGFLADAYNQYSYSGLSIVNGAISAHDGTRQIRGTDTVTGFVYPNTNSVWNPSVAPALPDEIQIIADNASTDFTSSILTGATLPACGTPALPGCGQTVSYLESTRQVPYDGNVGGVSGKSEQQVGIHWPTSGNVGNMWYYRFWTRIGSNFVMAAHSNGGAFYTVEESKTGTSSYRCSLVVTTGAHVSRPQWQIIADGFPTSGYEIAFQDQFDPAVFPVPINTWFLVEFAMRGSASSTGFCWAAINGHVLDSHFTFQSVPYKYVNGAHEGPNRPADEDINRIFFDMLYTNSSASSSAKLVADFARDELRTSFPSDASTPHP